MEQEHPASPSHISVLLREILDFAPKNARRLFDCTLGLGGHAKALLDAHPGASLIAFDRDTDALAEARERLRPYEGRIDLRHGDFRDAIVEIPEASLDYAIADLGVSSLQLDAKERGFSFRFDAPLDMRMDQSMGRSASDILNTASEKELERILTDFGEEPKAKAIARSLIMERRSRTVWTTRSFASVVRRDARGRPGLDPATRAFQALRIATNGELQSLGEKLEELARRLRPGGRLAVIAFHSLEDRIVKNAFRPLGKTRTFDVLTPKPVVPKDDEMRANPRSRSAKLRVIARASDEALEMAP